MAEEMTQNAVLEMVRSKLATPSRGAELLKMPLQDFLELMSKHHVSVLDYEPDEVIQDLKSLKKAFPKTKVSK
jgi:predicted HTH domain antitoxin